MKGIFYLESAEEIIYKNRGLRGVSADRDILDDHAAIYVLR